MSMLNKKEQRTEPYRSTRVCVKAQKEMLPDTEKNWCFIKKYRIQERIHGEKFRAVIFLGRRIGSLLPQALAIFKVTRVDNCMNAYACRLLISSKTWTNQIEQLSGSPVWHGIRTFLHVTIADIRRKILWITLAKMEVQLVGCPRVPDLDQDFSAA